MLIKTFTTVLLTLLLLAGAIAQAGKLAIVIDDFGYRPVTENQILAMPVNISIAVLPDAPYAHAMAVKAHQQGREILIHLPMAPLSKQPLEHNTLTPMMNHSQVVDIIRQATKKVPYAVGLNNHMGSAMTCSFIGMQHVMHALSHYSYYFLDSMTIGNSQSISAANGTGVRILKRQIFLDDIVKQTDIRQQFDRAVLLARRNGFSIAIGHPHPVTVHVLQQILAYLPKDIILVRPSMLLNAYSAINSDSLLRKKLKSKHPHPLYDMSYCWNHQVLTSFNIEAILDSIASSVVNLWHKHNIVHRETVLTIKHR